MKTYKDLLSEIEARPYDWHWDGGYKGHSVGNTVRINSPGHEHHGKQARIYRQNSVNYGVEVPEQPGKLHWFNAGQLN